MSNSSLIASLILGVVLAGGLGWLLRRWLNKGLVAASIASGVAFLVTVPVLLHNQAGLIRIVSPREAIDWLPVGLFVLSLATLLRVYDSKRAKVWAWLGNTVCVLLAIRMMWGSVYLRAGDIQWGFLTLILCWGMSMAWVFSRRIVDSEKSNLLDGILQLIAILIVAANLGMSGSMTYAAVGLLIAAIAAASWLGGRQLSVLMSVAVLGLLGLGPTFAETSWWVAGLLLISILGIVLVREYSGRRRAITLGIISVAALAGSAITVQAFRESLSQSNESVSGYEAYK